MGVCLPPGSPARQARRSHLSSLYTTNWRQLPVVH
ncbi:DUF4113 domain-containing protein [Marinobacter sp. AN1]